MRSFGLVTVAIRLILAVLFGGIIGLERGRQRRAAGLRTHILVCLGAALVTTVGFYSTQVLENVNADPMRVAAQVISGIGFLGVGTILVKGRFQITGLTTAAGLWVTAAIGIALGAGFYEGAIIAFIVTVISIVLLHRIERIINDKHSSFGVYTEISSDKEVRKCIDFLIEHFGARDIQVTAPRSGITGNVGIESSVCPSIKNNTMNVKDVTRALEEIEYVVFAIESI
jgi:putative Mg2+ transporter-C (MgtC) family protein